MPHPNLPPGCTPSDIDRAMMGSKCPGCGRREADGHRPNCPNATGPDAPYCIVCRPPVPADKRDVMVEAVGLQPLPFCEHHDTDDLLAKLDLDIQDQGFPGPSNHD